MKQLHHLSKIAFLSILLLVLVIDSNAQRKDTAAVKEAVDRFVKAFNALDWKPFRDSFADDASIFFPDWEWAQRRTGKEAVEKTWVEYFRSSSIRMIPSN